MQYKGSCDESCFAFNLDLENPLYDRASFQWSQSCLVALPISDKKATQVVSALERWQVFNLKLQSKRKKPTLIYLSKDLHQTPVIPYLVQSHSSLKQQSLQLYLCFSRKDVRVPPNIYLLATDINENTYLILIWDKHIPCPTHKWKKQLISKLVQHVYKPSNTEAQTTSTAIIGSAQRSQNHISNVYYKYWKLWSSVEFSPALDICSHNPGVSREQSCRPVLGLCNFTPLNCVHNLLRMILPTPWAQRQRDPRTFFLPLFPHSPHSRDALQPAAVLHSCGHNRQKHFHPQQKCWSPDEVPTPHVDMLCYTMLQIRTLHMTT